MPPKPGTETILVVDDEIAVLSLTNMMLTRYGYTVITAASAKEALHLFEVWPDLAVDLLLVCAVWTQQAQEQSPHATSQPPGIGGGRPGAATSELAGWTGELR